jgi:hypothetical protein
MMLKDFSGRLNLIEYNNGLPSTESCQFFWNRAPFQFSLIYPPPTWRRMNLETFLLNREELLVQFGIRVLQSDDFGGEYPLGEEPDEPQAPGQVFGFQNGFALTYCCYLHFCLRNDDEGLLEHLRAVRIPHARKVLEQLKAIYKALGAA